MKHITPELINSLTPILIATIGGIIGVAVLFVPIKNDVKGSSAIGLVGTTSTGQYWDSLGTNPT